MDGETKDGSSSEPQLAEPMDTWTGVGSSLLGKRKIETTDVEDLGDNEGDRESVDEEDEDSEEDPNWDKDSFDGREYHSSDDQGEFRIKALEKSTRTYRRTVIETKVSSFFISLMLEYSLGSNK